MHCFNHASEVAIGTCKACGKGLCKSCVVDMGHGLSCKGEHEATVQSHHEIIKRSERLVATAPRNIALVPAFCGVMGIVFVAWGLSSPDGIKDFTFALGCVFLVFGGLTYRQARRALIEK